MFILKLFGHFCLPYNIIKLLTSYARFQAFAAKPMRTALFWAIRQRVIAIPYRIFKKNYRLSRNVGQLLPLHDAK